MPIGIRLVMWTAIELLMSILIIQIDVSLQSLLASSKSVVNINIFNMNNVGDIA